ncbi:hypothetical protein [Actinomadura macra]|uniref:hypothetical protein n=1 Tax=Actinomadura macra TaxID=46164 RepID=UPI0012FA37B0|nr:hypothetical protein [Actinomadura macra]
MSSSLGVGGALGLPLAAYVAQHFSRRTASSSPTGPGDPPPGRGGATPGPAQRKGDGSGSGRRSSIVAVQGHR